MSKPTAAIYARFSSSNQREESIDAQVRAIEEYAERNNIKINKVYTDRAKSATTSDRPAFLDMINDSKKDLFDLVIVHKLDRFARNRYDSAVYKRKLRENGVEVISALENLDGSPESIILESVLEGYNEYYSANLRREVKKGMKENALNCKHNGGLAPLGFDVAEDKTYIINEEQAKSVKLIFEMYANGHGYSEIIDELKKKGFKTQTGGNFSRPSLHDILVNEKYRGVYIFNRTVSKKAGKRNHHKSKDEKKIIRVEGGMPRIIDDQTWRRVQKRMKGNKRSVNNKAKEVYLLTGLIRCGKCEGAMVGNRRVAGRNKTIYTSYECSTRKRKRDCDMPSISKDFVEKTVIDNMIEEIFSPEAIEKISSKVYRYAKEQNKEINSDIKRFEKHLKEVQKKIDNITEAVAEGLYQPSMKEKLDSLENEKADYEMYLEEARFQAENNSPSKEKIVETLMKYRNIKNESLEDQRRIVRTFVKKVTVYENNISIDYIVDVDGGGGAYHFESTINIQDYRR